MLMACNPGVHNDGWLALAQVHSKQWLRRNSYRVGQALCSPVERDDIAPVSADPHLSSLEAHMLLALKHLQACSLQAAPLSLDLETLCHDCYSLRNESFSVDRAAGSHLSYRLMMPAVHKLLYDCLAAKTVQAIINLLPQLRLIEV